MAVNLFAGEAYGSDGTQQAERKKKYLVAHSSEQKNSIFDYVCVRTDVMAADDDSSPAP